ERRRIGGPKTLLRPALATSCGHKLSPIRSRTKVEPDSARIWGFLGTWSNRIGRGGRMGCEVAKGNGTLGLLEAKVAAPLVKLPLKRLYYHADRGHIPSVRIGRRVLFSEAALAEFIANGGRGLAAARRRL